MQTLNSKKKAFTFVKIAIYIFYITIIIRVFFLMNEYESEIEKKDKIIKKYEQMEQLNCDKESEFSAVIKKYTNDSVLTIGGRGLSMSEVVSYIKERNDSIIGLKKELENAKTDYKYVVKQTEGKLLYNDKDKKKIDSGLILLQMFRKNMKYNSIDSTWQVKMNLQ